MLPYSIYIHVPFCQERCYYCDFNTYAGVEHLIPAYLVALQEEIRYLIPKAGKRLPVHTIFFGGGTPSLLSTGQTGKILDELSKGFDLQDGAEISLEANPGTVTARQLIELQQMGFNRISFGVQSFHDQELIQLGRIHDVEDTMKAFRWAAQAGFKNLSLDLIFGLPGQNLARWKYSLKNALSLTPTHISLYALTVEEQTPFHRWYQRGLMETIDDDLAADQYELASEMLEQAGYSQYEISNWSIPGMECLHNLQYWRMKPYLGLGAGAHGYDCGKRMANVSWIGAYIKRMEEREVLEFPFSPANESRILLEVADEMNEFMMVGLRLVNEGVSEREFTKRFGKTLVEVYGKPIEKLEKRNLIERKPEDRDRIRLTKQGRLLGNQVFLEFV
jgi:oxygen-independent coproporphyrinogen-3 oxidase